MAGWSLVATIKAPAEQILAFAAHHLMLGVDHLWLYFDEPLAQVPAPLANHPKITVTLCDEDYWQRRGKRPEKHQVRQSRNANDAYRRTTSVWLTHIDVDEFILAERSVADILSEVPSQTDMVQMEPFEAMHDPGLPDDIFTARYFRGPLRTAHAALRPIALGGYETVFSDGMLSHKAGKAFFRTKVEGLSLRIHGAFQHGTRISPQNRHPEMRLLHFHAQDRDAWRAALPFRLTRGAYQFQPDLQAYLASATDNELDAFYLATQVPGPAAVAALTSAQRLLTADLQLRQKVANVFGDA